MTLPPPPSRRAASCASWGTSWRASWRASWAAALFAAPLVACGAPPGAAGPPVTTDPRGLSDLPPESPNSLPPGFLTDHPFTPRTGNIGTFRVP